MPSWGDDSNSYCWPSLGLGTAGAEILGGRLGSQSRDPGGTRLGSTQNEAHRAGAIIPYLPVDPLWGSEIPDIVVYFVVCMCVVFVVYIVV